MSGAVSLAPRRAGRGRVMSGAVSLAPRSARRALEDGARLAAIVVVAGGAVGALTATLSPAAVLVASGLAIGYLGGVPAAIVAIAVPARIPFPVLHSVSWADAVILGASLREADRGMLRIRLRWGALGALSVLALCSLAVSIDRTLTLRALIVLGEGLMLALATRNYVARRTDTPDAFLRLWLMLGLFSAVAALILFCLSHPLVWWNLQKPPDAASLVAAGDRLGSPFWGPSNYYASILLLFLPAAWQAIVTSRQRLLGCVSLAAMVPALFLTTSRGAVLALAVGGMYLAARLVRAMPRVKSSTVRDRRMLSLLLAVVLVGVLCVFGPRLLAYFFLSRDVQVGSLASGGRLAAYQAVLSLLPAHLLLGVGYGAAFSAAPALAGGTHCYVLTLLLELGVPGLVCGVWAAVTALRAMATQARLQLLGADARAVLVRSGLAALVLTLINIQVEASFEGVVFFWLFSIMMGAAFGSFRPVVTSRRARGATG